MTRNIEIKLRLSRDEMQTLTRNVKKTGMSREGYLRTLIRGYEPQALPPMDYYEILRELQRIENSMRLISDRAVIVKPESAVEYKENAVKLSHICDTLVIAFVPRRKE